MAESPDAPKPAEAAPAPAVPAPVPPVPAAEGCRTLNPVLAIEINGGLVDPVSGLHFSPGCDVMVPAEHLGHIDALTYPRMAAAIPTQPTANELPATAAYKSVQHVPLVVACTPPEVPQH